MSSYIDNVMGRVKARTDSALEEIARGEDRVRQALSGASRASIAGEALALKAAITDLRREYDAAIVAGDAAAQDRAVGRGIGRALRIAELLATQVEHETLAAQRRIASLKAQEVGR